MKKGLMKENLEKLSFTERKDAFEADLLELQKKHGIAIIPKNVVFPNNDVELVIKTVDLYERAQN